MNEKVRLFLSSCLTSEAMLSLKEGLVHLTPCKNPILIRKWEKGTIILSFWLAWPGPQAGKTVAGRSRMAMRQHAVERVRARTATAPDRIR